MIQAANVVLALLSVSTTVQASIIKATPTLAKRQNPYPTGPAYDVPSLSAISFMGTDYSSNTLPIMATYTSGAPASLESAPALPDPTGIRGTVWPKSDEIPDENSPEVDVWFKEINWDLVPDHTPTVNRTVCSDPRNPPKEEWDAAGGRCWWTCGGKCTRELDITTCQNRMEYGHGYDDGPGYYTPKLLTFLESKQLHATFYLVGSRVMDRPEVVRYQYETGHEISVHTWSHGGSKELGLTQMTNRQIVAELGWTRKIIKDTIGVTPTTMRPPYGDIDDRVRAISLQMGMVPIIWTGVRRADGGELDLWDSQDYLVHQNSTDAVTNQKNFEEILNKSKDLDYGVIALQHDNNIEPVNLAIGYTLPFLLNSPDGFKVMPVMQCQGRPSADMYKETQTDQQGPWSESGDVATLDSNLGHNTALPQASMPPRTYVGSGSGAASGATPTTTKSAGFRGATMLHGSALLAIGAGAVAMIL